MDISGATDSELAQRGPNREGRHRLRHIGLGLMVARDGRLPLFYRSYGGNVDDSRLFAAIMEERTAVSRAGTPPKQRLTVVADKGMSSEVNLQWSYSWCRLSPYHQ